VQVRYANCQNQTTGNAPDSSRPFYCFKIFPSVAPLIDGDPCVHDRSDEPSFCAKRCHASRFISVWLARVFSRQVLNRVSLGSGLRESHLSLHHVAAHLTGTNARKECSGLGAAPPSLQIVLHQSSFACFTHFKDHSLRPKPMLNWYTVQAA
jgi:hypothetical protein